MHLPYQNLYVHLPFDIVLEQFLINTVELSAADVVKVIGDVTGVFLSTRAIGAIKLPVTVLIIKVSFREKTQKEIFLRPLDYLRAFCTEYCH